jgi:transposase-like protein
MDSKYRIQFQNGLSLPEFINRFGTREQCEEYLYKAKWSQGFICKNCGSTHAISYNKVKHTVFQCSCCHTQTSLLVDTIFERTHLPLTTWFLAIYLISQAKTGISALDLHRKLGVNHKTAWLMHHKLMHAMIEEEKKTDICGRIEMDDAYLGGKSKGGKRGRGSENKQPFIAAVSTDENKHPLQIKLDPIDSFTLKNVKIWTKNHIAEGSHIVTDALNCFAGVEETCTHEVHTSIFLLEEEKEEHFKWMNTVLANVKTLISGTFHSIECHRYAFRYFGEITYRFNRRFNLRKIFHDLCNTVVKTSPITAKIISLST